MEDTNKISGSPLDRVENLERIINKFRIAVAGGGNVEAKFGQLPKNQEKLPIEQRLNNIQKARSEFSVKGQNVEVAGSFKNGFTLS